MGETCLNRHIHKVLAEGIAAVVTVGPINPVAAICQVAGPQDYAFNHTRSHNDLRGLWPLTHKGLVSYVLIDLGSEGERPLRQLHLALTSGGDGGVDVGAAEHVVGLRLP